MENSRLFMNSKVLKKKGTYYFKNEDLEMYSHIRLDGSLKDGNGSITSQRAVLKDAKYDFNLRFGDGKRTFTGQLRAAAHAGCYAMTVSHILGEAGCKANSLEVTSVITMDADNLEQRALLTLKARIPNIGKDKLMECANVAKNNCTLSKELHPKITLNAEPETIN